MPANEPNRVDRRTQRRNDVEAGAKAIELLGPLLPQGVAHFRRLSPDALAEAGRCMLSSLRRDVEIVGFGQDALRAHALLTPRTRQHLISIAQLLGNERAIMMPCLLYPWFSNLIQHYGRQRTTDYNESKDCDNECISSYQHAIQLKSHVLDVTPRRPPHKHDKPIEVYRKEHATDITPSTMLVFTWHTDRVLQGVVTSCIQTAAGNTMFMCTSCVAPSERFEVCVSFPVPKGEHLTGATIRIYDPYLRIDRSGNVGVRVDHLGDVQFLRPTTSSRTVKDGKAAGDELLRCGERSAALSEYLAVLRQQTPFSVQRPTQHIDTVVALLTNASLAYLKLDDHKHALIAAAWARFIEPSNAKAFARYEEARNLLKLDSDDACMRVLLCDGRMPCLQSPLDSTDRAADATTATLEDRKKEGNDCFNAGHYQAAIHHYISALRASFTISDSVGSELAGLCSNIANVCFSERLWHPVLVASSMAAFFDPTRIDLVRRNVRRYSLALLHLGCPQQAAELQATEADLLKEDKEGVAAFEQLRGERNGQYDVASVCNGKARLAGEFQSPAIEVGTSKGDKGRGVFATRDIQRGELLIVSKAMASFNENDRSPRDPRVASSVSYGHTTLDKEEFALYTRKASSQIANCWLHDFYLLCNDEPSSLDQQVSIHSHSKGWLCKPLDVAPHRHLTFDLGRILETSSCNSFDAVHFFPSLLNHDHDCNTHRTHLDDWMFFYACRTIRKGEEVTTLYFPPEEELSERERRLQWSIPPSVFPSNDDRLRTVAIHEELMTGIQNLPLVGVTDLRTFDRLQQIFEMLLALPDSFPKGIQNALLGMCVGCLSNCTLHVSPLDALSGPWMTRYLQFCENHGLVVHASVATGLKCMLCGPQVPTIIRDVAHQILCKYPFLYFNLTPTELASPDGRSVINKVLTEFTAAATLLKQ